MDYRIGTSGFSFADWQGPFFPQGLPKSRWLEYYAERFNTLEINSTYYGIPRPQVAERMVQRTPDTFDFMVKAHSSFTHERHKAAESRRAYLEAIAPFVASGKLAGILAQFPYAFQHSRANLDYLLSGRDYFPDQRLFVEFRHDSWSQRPVFYALRDAGIGWVSVDLPELPRLPERHALAATDTAYLRLHGRNSEKWYGGGDQRYDYLYSRDELIEWKEKLLRLEGRARTAYVFLNNCYRGQAVRNAQELIELFEL